MKTKVIFRKFRDGGDVIALFPQIAANNRYNLMSYTHVGQHGAASPNVVSITKLATPDEYATLEDELTRIGYDLKITKRLTYADQLLRAKEYNSIAGN